jgi:microcystin-dependent protein
MQKEHVQFADGTAGGEHIAGGCGVCDFQETTSAMETGYSDGTYKGAGLVWCYSASGNYGVLYCSTFDGTVDSGVGSDDPTVMLLHPDLQWGGGDITWTGAHQFDSTVNFNGLIQVKSLSTFDVSHYPTVAKGIATKGYVDDKAVPVGCVQMWAGVYTSPPEGWLICRGGAVSRTTYSDLWDLIGTTYGSGNGSTTFNVPNFLGRVPIGMSGTYALGATGGFATHTLTTNEMPAHTHTYTRPDNGLSSLTGNTALRDRTTGVATGSTGGGAAHNNLQPYLSINYIIKH